MIDNSKAFKEELKALMEKYNVCVDLVENRGQVHFYTDLGRGQATTLQFDFDSETMGTAAELIK